MHHDQLVRFEVSKYQQLKQRLLTDFPGVDEETVLDTLEEIASNA